MGISYKMRTCCGSPAKLGTVVILYSDLISIIALAIVAYFKPSLLWTLSDARRGILCESIIDVRLLVVCFAVMIACVMGLHAVSNEKSNYLVPYLTMRFVWTIFYISFVALLSITALFNDPEKFRYIIEEAIPVAIINLISCGTSFWIRFSALFFTIVVPVVDIDFMRALISCYNEIRKNERQKEKNVAASIELGHGVSAKATEPTP